MSPCRAATAYRGPLIVIGLGIGFVAVGSIPVAVTFSLGTKNSATIIGVGFIGFGLLLVLPGILWCLVRRITTFRCCTKRKRLRSVETQEKTPSFENIPSDRLVVTDSKTVSPKSVASRNANTIQRRPIRMNENTATTRTKVPSY